jgi:hypothetical protein
MYLWVYGKMYLWVYNYLTLSTLSKLFQKLAESNLVHYPVYSELMDQLRVNFYRKFSSFLFQLFIEICCWGVLSCLPTKSFIMLLAKFLCVSFFAMMMWGYCSEEITSWVNEIISSFALPSSVSSTPSEIGERV